MAALSIITEGGKWVEIKSALIAVGLGINDQDFGHCDLSGIHRSVHLIHTTV